VWFRSEVETDIGLSTVSGVVEVIITSELLLFIWRYSFSAVIIGR
jgi:hypothetical protein